MADNNFLRNLYGLPPEQRTLGTILGGLDAPVERKTLGTILGGGFDPVRSQAPTLLGRFGGPGLGYQVSVPSDFPVNALGLTPPAVVAPPRPVMAPPVVPQQRKRRTFFSFHFDDLFRVNNVRNQVPGGETTFYDSSLWERRKLTDDEAIKRLIREGIDSTSVVCVLVGTHTYSRRWCRYEIARAVIDKRGLLAVDINGIRHHRELVTHPRGPNPLDYMAVGKMRDGTYRLFEKRFRHGQVAGEWFLYEDYRFSVDLPKYLPEPVIGHVTPLSNGTAWYDYAAQSGSKNLGGWVDMAAARVGR